MATKPKKERGFRITSPAKKQSNQKGRPPGTRLRRKFDETRLGFMLKHETPLEYNLIMANTEKSVFVKPDIDLIEAICGASNDESFLKLKFIRYLDEYRENGIHCDRPKIMTDGRKLYYEDIRRNKVKKYMIDKKAELKKML